MNPMQRQSLNDARYGAVKRVRLEGDSVAAVIAAMWAMMEATDDTQAVHRLASAIAAQSGRKDFAGQVRGIFGYIKAHVVFKRDTWGREVVRDPDQLIAEIQANGRTSCDCDDVATLGAAMIRAIGFRPILITSAAAAGLPFSHVYFGLSHKGIDIPLDPQERKNPGEWTGLDKVGVWDYPVRDPYRFRTPRKA